MKLIAAAGAIVAIAVSLTVATFFRPVVHNSQPAETIYLVNHSDRSITDKTIRKDIPAWEQAANGMFSSVWHTPQVRLRLVSHAPADSISALFVKSGPIQGALAYHTVQRGEPQIIVYAGVGNFYGYSNSVSFTHELFEMLADHDINSWNWHWQSNDPVYFVGRTANLLPRGSFWFNEICDPVEAYSYGIDHVAISDWVTPNWFGDQVNGSYDYMNLIHEPLQTLRGGYSQFVANGQFNLVQFFRGAGPDASGFLKGERLGH